MGQIKITVSTHQGKLYDEFCDSLVVKNDSGEFGILQNHIPVCSAISNGYVKLEKDNVEYYLCVINALVEFNNNVCNVVAQEAHIGKSHEEAIKHLDDVRNSRLEENRKVNADYTKSEHDIRENLKKAKAGSL